MKQAIQEGFILDVLEHYTPVESYYKLVKTVEGDPEFDTKRAKKKLRRYVESHDHAIRLKAEIMVDHFHEQVLGAEQDRRPGAGDGGDAAASSARSSTSTRSATTWPSARARTGRSSRSPASTSTAATKVTEASLNGFPSSQIADRIQEDPYRFLVCADKFQTGYDEPLLHTMYVDKVALGHQGGADALAPQPRAPAEARRLRARLHERRRHDRGGVRRLLPHDDPQRGDRPEQAARPEGRRSTATRSTRRRRSTSSSSCTSAARTATSSTRSSTPASPSTRSSSTRTGRSTSRARPRRSRAPTASSPRSCRTRTPEWEKLSIFLNFLVPKLPAPDGGGPVEGHPRSDRHGQLPGREAGGGEDPAPRRGRGDRAGADRRAAAASPSRSSIGSRTSSRPSTTSSATSPWTDADRVHKLITEEIPSRVAADTAYQNAKQNSDKQNARIEHDKALARVMTARAEGRHGALQAVQRQRVVPALADGHGVRAHLRTIGGRSASEHATQRPGWAVDSFIISERPSFKNNQCFSRVRGQSSMSGKPTQHVCNASRAARKAR